VTEPLALAATLCALLAVALMALRLRKARKRLRADTAAWEQRLQQDLERVRVERDHLLDALGDAFLLVDARGRIGFANAAARTLLRDRPLTGLTIDEAFLEPRLAEPVHRCLSSGQAVQQCVVLPQHASPRAAGESRGDNAWMIDAAPLTTPGPEDGTCLRVIVRDVTTAHQTEQVRKDFVANASHELRTPLAIINGYLENLIEDNLVEDRETSLRFLKIMRKHSDRISRIIEDMLVISRLESGEAAALKIEPFRFQACIHDVLERLESVIRSQSAEVVTAMPDPELIIEGDRFYWTQVLFNLVENALKQNPAKGVRVEIGCAAEQDGTRIWVSDNGIGIPSADLPFIFKRFYRVEKHHSQEDIKGTGLGLSIVKRAVEAHGGTIEVASVPGRETRFTIRLPRPAATVTAQAQDS
jgi:signal transduction histidine kinase